MGLKNICSRIFQVIITKDRMGSFAMVAMLLYHMYFFSICYIVDICQLLQGWAKGRGEWFP